MQIRQTRAIWRSVQRSVGLAACSTLLACGGGGNGGGAGESGPGAPSARQYAGVNANFWPTPCTVPLAVKFVPVAAVSGRWQIQRQQLDDPTGAWRVLAVNPQNNPTHAPIFIQNCSPGDHLAHPEDTQWLRFKMRTTDYFGAEVGDHLVVMLRARFEEYDTDFPKINGRGIIFHAQPNGIFYERFANRSTDGFVDFAPASNLALGNDTNYAVEVLATSRAVRYTVTDIRTGQTVTGRSPLSTPSGSDALTPYGGIALAMLCSNAAGGTCDAMTRAAGVQFEDIQTGWR